MRQHEFKPKHKNGRVCQFEGQHGNVCRLPRNSPLHRRTTADFLVTAALDRNITTVGLPTAIERSNSKSFVFASPYGDNLTAFEGGATRTAKAERRELIPKSAIDAIARRLALGAKKHGENNWRKGGAEFRLATINHLLDHVLEYIENGGKENTDAIICNAAFLCEYEERLPYKGVPDGPA